MSMRALTLVRLGRLEWRDVPEPRLRGPGEAIVRPVIAARCDGDALPILKVSAVRAMRSAVVQHGYLDPIAVALLGRKPFQAPISVGHECVAEVVACGDDVRQAGVGDLVVVPWSVSCGTCARCHEGLTSRCASAGPTLLSGYGFGSVMGPWGGMVSDRVRVPYADAMLVRVPPGVAPVKLASASDNLPDAWRTVGPHLERFPGAPVLVVGGGAKSIGLYAAGMAVALGAGRVDYLDDDRERLQIAERLGANAIEKPAGGRWFNRNAPVIHGDYRIGVEASSTASGLRFALRSLAPGSVCTAVGFYFAKGASLPLMQMYVDSTTLHVGLAHPRRDLPHVIALIAAGRFDPSPVATLVADWEDAPTAFATPATKVIVRRNVAGVSG